MTRVAIIQMTSGSDPESNYQYIAQECAKAAKFGARLVLTPENTLVFGTTQDYHRIAEVLGEGEYQQKFAQLAADLAVTLVIGSMPIRTESGVTTTTVVFGPDGQRLAHYDKLHMFDVDVADGHQQYRESDTFTPGSETVVVDSVAGKLGLSICYDLRFPALYQVLREAGADIMLVPAAFTAVTGKAHWQTLLTARAIETQCWILASNQGGVHPCGRETWGHSMVISPWGEVVAQLEQTPDLLFADLDITYNRRLNNAMPLAQHNRFIHTLNKEKSPS